MRLQRIPKLLATVSLMVSAAACSFGNQFTASDVATELNQWREEQPSLNGLKFENRISGGFSSDVFSVTGTVPAMRKADLEQVVADLAPAEELAKQRGFAGLALSFDTTVDGTEVHFKELRDFDREMIHEIAALTGPELRSLRLEGKGRLAMRLRGADGDTQLAYLSQQVEPRIRKIAGEQPEVEVGNLQVTGTPVSATLYRSTDFSQFGAALAELDSAAPSFRLTSLEIASGQLTKVRLQDRETPVEPLEAPGPTGAATIDKIRQVAALKKFASDLGLEVTVSIGQSFGKVTLKQDSTTGGHSTIGYLLEREIG